MRDEDKTKKQLINELCELRQRIADLETLQIKSKKAEQALEESEEKFRSFMEYSPIYVFFKDDKIRSILLSKNYEQMLGRPIHELLGKTMYDLFPSDLAKSMIADDMRILEEGKPLEVEEEFNGRIYSTLKFPIIQDGVPKYLAGFTIDITDRKRIQKALKEREKELQSEARNLEEANIALKVLLQRRDEDKAELEDKVLLNIKGLVTPYLEKLKMSGLDESQKAYVTILESSLNQITSSFLHRLSFSFANFTPTEIQVANLLKQGKTSKEIGELLNSSSRTIAFHRDNIRKRLGLKNKKTNLKSYLLSLK